MLRSKIHIHRNQNAFNANLLRQNAGIYYMVTATLMTIGILITVLGVHEIPYRRTSPDVEREKTIASFAWRLVHHWVEPWRKYNFTLVFLTRTAIMLGLSLFMTYVEYYFARVQNVANFVATTALIAVLALGGGVISGILSGVLSDRMKRQARAKQCASPPVDSQFIYFICFIPPPQLGNVRCRTTIARY